MRCRTVGRMVGLTTLAAFLAIGVSAQESSDEQGQERPRVKSRDVLPTQDGAQESTQNAPESEPQPIARGSHAADGRRHGDLPAEAYAVVPGTKFLVRLDDELDTKATREKKRFKVTTLEPMEAGSGIYLPAGAEIHGHVSRIEPAGITGRAKIWLTFDDIRLLDGVGPRA